MKKEGRNKTGKLVVLWKERGHYTIGVQGTSAWYGYKEKEEAVRKFYELLNGDDA